MHIHLLLERDPFRECFNKNVRVKHNMPRQSINVCLVMSLAPLNLRGLPGMFSSSRLAGITQPQHSSTLKRLSSTCCHLSNPACLESLSCLAIVLASSTETQSRLSSLAQQSVSCDHEVHGHAIANMYGFHF